MGNTKVGIIGNVFFSRDVLGNWITADPTQSVNYVESHDNLTLADKIAASVPGVTPATLAKLDRLSASIPLLAQGVPFIQAGQEFLRSKKGDANSYKSDDSINSLKWNLRTENASTVAYYKGLIALRAAHPAFRMSTTSAVQKNFRFISAPSSVITYVINGAALKDSWKSIFVAHNPNTSVVTVSLPIKGDWKVVVKGATAGTKVLLTLKAASKVSVDPQTTLVLEK
jgi:pullulanase